MYTYASFGHVRLPCPICSSISITPPFHKRVTLKCIHAIFVVCNAPNYKTTLQFLFSVGELSGTTLCPLTRTFSPVQFIRVIYFRCGMAKCHITCGVLSSLVWFFCFHLLHFCPFLFSSTSALDPLPFTRRTKIINISIIDKIAVMRLSTLPTLKR